MSHLILHIGTHKTGTTTIQDSFWTNTTKLAALGIVYPRLHYRHSGHHGLIAGSVGLPRTFHLKTGGEAALEWVNKTYSQSETSVFLSSEEFSRAQRSRSVDFQWLRHKLSGFDRVTVLCFLRPQWRFLQSIYLEVSRSRSPPRLPDLVQEAIETGRCQGLYMRYGDLMHRLRIAFAPEEIALVDFETVKTKKNGILATALSSCGINEPPADLRVVKQGHSNKSPHALSQWAANLLAEPYVASESLRSATQTVLKNHRPTYVLTRAEIAQLNAVFAEDNAALIASQREVQPSFGLTDPALPDDCMHREDVSIEHWLHIGKTLARPMVATG